MSGAGLDDLDWPRPSYWPNARREFASRATCRRHDAERAVALLSTTDLTSTTADPASVRELASRLSEAAQAGVDLPTRASQVCQGELRIRIGGAFAELIDQDQRAGSGVAFITLCPRGGDVRPEEMRTFNPRHFAKRLDQALNRALDQIVPQGRRRTGWSVFFVEGEYQLADDLYRMHWHGFACGDELRAIEALRNTRAFRSPTAKRGDTRDLVRHRIKRTRQPLHSLEYLGVYPLKDWRARSVPTNQAGTCEREWPVSVPDHLMPLEWLFRDRWPIHDISVLRGLRVIDGRLAKTRPAFVDE